MKSRGGTLGAGGLDAPAFVARPTRALRGGSGRVRRGRAAEAGQRRGACERAGSHAVYIWSSRATDQGEALPRQGRWRGKTRHIIGPLGRPTPRQPCAAPPCMARHRYLAAPGQ